MLPTGISSGYAPSPLLTRRNQQQQRPSLPAEVLFGARAQKLSKDDDAVKKHLAEVEQKKLAEKKADWEVRTTQLQERTPGLQNHIHRLTSALDRVERELIREGLSEAERTRLNNEKTAYETERKDWQKQLALLTEKTNKAHREYETAKRKADETGGNAWGKTAEELKKEEEKKEKEAKAKREEESLKKSAVVVNNYLSGEAGKKTEGATEVKSATGTAAKTDSKANGKADGKIPMRAAFIAQQVDDESHRIASDLDYYFGHENLKTSRIAHLEKIPLVGRKMVDAAGFASRFTNAPVSAVMEKIPGVGSMLVERNLKPETKVAPEIEDVAKGVREKLEKALKSRKGIYADLSTHLKDESGKVLAFNPKDCHGLGIDAKKYAKTAINNAAIHIAREAMDYPEDMSKHKEYQKKLQDKWTAQYESNQLKVGAGVALLGGAYMLGIPGAASLVALPFRAFSFLPLPGLSSIAGGAANAITSNSTGLAGKLLGGPIRMLTAGGVTMMGGSMFGETLWNKTKNLLDIQEASQLSQAITNKIDEKWGSGLLGTSLKGGWKTAARAKGAVGQLWNSPTTVKNAAQSVDGALGNKPSQLAGKTWKTAVEKYPTVRDGVTSRLGWKKAEALPAASVESAAVKNVEPESPFKTADAKPTTVSGAAAPEKGSPEPAVPSQPEVSTGKPTGETVMGIPLAGGQMLSATKTTAEPKAQQQHTITQRVITPALNVTAGSGLIAGGLALHLPVVTAPIGIAMTAGGFLLAGHGVKQLWERNVSAS